MRLTFLAAAAVAATLAAGQAAAVVVAISTIVPNAPATGAAGVTLSFASLSATDTTAFSVSDTAFLQTGTSVPSYGVNASGIQTSIGLDPGYPGAVGTSLNAPSGFTYGALVATLSGASGTVSVQVFAPNAANGAGSATPPGTLTFSGSFASLFGSFTSEAKTINFRVEDTGYADNAGQFVIAAVPEPATWALMITGFGLVGVTARRRKAALAA